MPANLTPEYERAEEHLRQAATDDERIAALEEMLSTLPKHKGTERMQADIKRRLSQLRREQQRLGHAKAPDPFHIPKCGAGQVALLGLPNTGKSSLLAATTNAEVKIADYPLSQRTGPSSLPHQTVYLAHRLDRRRSGSAHSSRLAGGDEVRAIVG